jgi:hypothetical protein
MVVSKLVSCSVYLKKAVDWKGEVESGDIGVYFVIAVGDKLFLGLVEFW